MIEKLAEFDVRLEDVFLIKGVGLTSNVYVIGRSELTTIDAGNGALHNRLHPEFESVGLDITKVRRAVITHAHYDHANGLREIVSMANPMILIYHSSAKYFTGLDHERVRGLHDGDIIEAQRYKLRVIYTPGHTEDSICLYEESKRILFTGDTVFADGTFGNFPPGGEEAIIESLEKLSHLKVDVILAGHGRLVFRDGGLHINMAYESAKTLVKG